MMQVRRRSATLGRITDRLGSSMVGKWLVESSAQPYEREAKGRRKAWGLMGLMERSVPLSHSSIR